MKDLTREFAAVWAPSAQAATRFARQLKAGEPVRLLADLAFAPLVVFHAPGVSLAPLVERAARELSWEGRSALLWDDSLDSAALAPLAAQGALAASACLAPDLGSPLAILEGDRQAVRAGRRWLAAAAIPSLKLAPGGKTRFLASWAAAAACLLPLIEGVADGLESAGLAPDRAKRLAARWIDAGVAAYAFRHRGATSEQRLRLRDQSLRRGLESLAAHDPQLLGRYETVLASVAELLSRPWFAGLSNEPLRSI
jgi:hypothetical protein